MSSFRSVLSSPEGSRTQLGQEPDSQPSSIRSTPQPGASTPSLSEHDDDVDNFDKLISIEVDQPVGSMSISPTNRDVALGTRKGLFIVDLASPHDLPRFLPHYSSWEVADVQWAVFPHRAEHVASTSNQKAVVYNLSFAPTFSASPIEHTLHAHTRTVTDINWSTHNPDILATCALDGWLWSWDLRAGFGGTGGARKPVWGASSFGTAATQVKWNRREPHVIASAHDNKVLIWDDRMGALPVTTMQAHNAKIYGIDWSRRETDKLVTASLDKSFKTWNWKQPERAELSVHTASPVWRARFLPFGAGMLTLPQRSDHALSIWSKEQVERGPIAQPIARFEGARGGVKEFVWRIKGGADLDNDDRQFQLVSLSADRRIRLWPISEEIMSQAGHVPGSQITVPYLRQPTSDGPERSFRSFHELPAAPIPLAFPVSPPPSLPRHLGPGPSLLSASLASSAPSVPTSSLLSAGFAALGSVSGIPSRSASPASVRTGPKLNTAVMTTTPVKNNRRQKAEVDQAWREGIKDEGAASAAGGQKVTLGGAAGVGAGVAGEGVSMTRASSMVRGTDGGTVTAREGAATERAESAGRVTESVATGTAVQAKDRGPSYTNLGDELTKVVARLKGGTINFEKVLVDRRSCTVSLKKGHFLRATFAFPKGYPEKAAPTIDLERNVDVPLKTRAFLLQSVRRLMAKQKDKALPSFELALRFLLGDRSGLDDEAKEEDDDDDQDDAVAGLILGDGGDELLADRRNPVPPPRRGGAVFDARGRLFCFSDVIAVAPVVPETSPRTRSPSDQQGLSRSKTSGPVRVSDAFGHLGAVGDELDGDYQETDEALQMSTGLSFRETRYISHKPLVIGPAPPPPPTFSSIVRVRDVSYLTLVHPDRAVCRLGPGTIPLEIAHAAALSALAARDAFQAKVWAMLGCFFEAEAEAGTGQAALTSLVAERVVKDLMAYLIHLKDIQTLGLIACLLEIFTRGQGHPPPSTHHFGLHRSPGTDYFSGTHRVPHAVLSPASSYGTGMQTPLAAGQDSRRPSGASGGLGHSPRPSGFNLSGLFNTSMISLKSGASSPADRQTPMAVAETSPSYWQHQPTHGLGQVGRSATAPAVGSFPPGQLGSGLSGLGSSSPLRVASPSPMATAPKVSPELRFADVRPSLLRHGSSPGGGVTGRRLRQSPGGSQVAVTFGATSLIDIKASPSMPVTAPSSAGHHGSNGTPPVNGLGGEPRRRGVRVQLGEGAAETSRRGWPWWAAGELRGDLERLRLGYAGLLERWGSEFDHERLWVLKLCHPRLDVGRGGKAGVEGWTHARIKAGNGVDSTTGPALGSAVEGAQESALPLMQAAQCALCHLPVPSLSRPCTLCRHLLHLDCARAWFDQAGSDDCPAGCGCRCERDGGSAGVFSVSAAAAGAGGHSRQSSGVGALSPRSVGSVLSPVGPGGGGTLAGRKEKGWAQGLFQAVY